MKSICFFNNKGGVGKTTLICNIASFITTEYGHKVLLVDADPQCNATQFVLGNGRATDLYYPQSSRSSTAKNNVQTLSEILKPISRGEVRIADEIKPINGNDNGFRVDIIPGDPRMALLEDKLSQQWVSLKSGDFGGLRVTNWNAQLCQKLENKEYDIVLYDVGPSLGALNRSVLIGVDYFVTPMGCDIFSILGIVNISDWLRIWLKQYRKALDEFATSDAKDELKDYSVKGSDAQIARFIGYTVQQYITKVILGERRPTVAFEKIRRTIPATVKDNMNEFLANHLQLDKLNLGDVPSMFSLVPLSQKAGKPIHLLESKDGLVGAQYSQKENYIKFIRELAQGVIMNAGIKSEK